MRIQLIHPPIYVNRRAVQATRPSLPLGLAYIAAALREAGHEVSVLDAVALAPDRFTLDGRLDYVGLGPEEIAECVDAAAGAFGVSAMFSFSWPLVRRILECVKARYPEKPVIGGGEHFTGMAEYSLRSAPLDYLILGEAEETARELFGALASGKADASTIPGLAFLQDGALVRTAPRPRIRDLDALPWPAWDLFDPETYYKHGYIMGLDAGMTMPVLATRGCPYACTYCSNAMMWGNRWYARDPVKVVEEIEHYHKAYGATNFPFHDLTAGLKKAWLVAFCEELLRRDLRVAWQLPIGTRCEAIDEGVADLLRQTGCTSITFGPESGSKRTRRLVGKQMDEATLMRAAKACARRGLNVSSFFVVGFPHDTRADLRQSIRLAFKLALAGTNDIALSYFFPTPGTVLYDQLVESGRVVPSDEVLLTPMFSMDFAIGEENNYCEALSARALTRMKCTILLTFYLTSFVVRPWRVFELVWNVIRGRETCRMDVFLNERKRRLLGRLGL